MRITHSKVSAIPDSSDTSLVRPSDWNDDHVINDPTYIYALDHGAVGDGTTDNTEALQDAIDEAEALQLAGAGQVDIVLPGGTFISDPIYITASNIILRGSGDATIIKYKAGEVAGGATSLGVVNIHGLVGSRIKNSGLRDIKVDGNKANLTLAGGGTALNVEAVSFIYVDFPIADYVTTINSYSDGIDFDECAYGRPTNCHAEDCDGWGIHFSTGCTRMNAEGCTAHRCGVEHTRGGFDVYSTASKSGYTNCHTEDCYRGFVLGGEFGRLTGCTDDASDTNSFRLEGNHGVVTSCISTGVTAGNGITISGDFNTVAACVANGASSHGITAISGALHNTINCCITRLNGSNGIILAAGANSNIVTNNIALGNTSAQITDSGSSNTLDNNKTS